MTQLLSYLDDRLGEASTWSAIAAFLTLMHVNIDPGTWHTITAWGGLASVLLGVMLAEKGAGKSAAQIAQDLVNTLRQPQGTSK